MVTRDGIIACYMMSNQMHGSIYIGVSGDLIARIGQHREGRGSRHTSKYGLKRLVWYQPFELMTVAIQREKSLKRYERDWKCNLIERMNPDWSDLYNSLVTGGVAVPPDPDLYRDWTPKEAEPPKPRPLPKDWPTSDEE
ncbi:GIY-YIG nuclease family protein [Brevundimonas sp.]|uniref:GIY-YIG nuclease family protein n=2 Tax=unclassified Brevundimonas TaxID=2622653 RepID=UPI001A3580BD|nr:GIY-YIG nuclease family protein [Brevundimonas sp.]